MIPQVDRIDAGGHWRDSDKIWLRERYAAVSLGTSAEEMFTSDPADFDLRWSFPAAD